MATINNQLGNYEQSLAMNYRLLAIEYSLNDHYSVATCLQNIGIIFKETGRSSEALEKLHEALQMFDSLDAQSDVANVLVGIANTEVFLEQYDSARTHYLNALNIYMGLEHQWGEAMTLANIAYMYDGQQQYDSALIYHLKGLAIREVMPAKTDLARSLLAVGRGYRQVSQFSKAQEFLMKGLDLANEIESKPIMSNAYHNLSQLYAAMDRYEEAFEFKERHQQISEELLDENKSKQLQELTAKYETEQKEQEIALLSSENQLYQARAQRQATLRNALIAGAIMILIIAALVIYTMRQRMANEKALARKNEEIKVSNLKEQLKSLEFKALRAQMNPHFLFNCLNSINRMILSKDNQHASQYLTKFSKLVRMMLENSEQPEVSLKDELEMLEAYIQLESLRFKNKIEHQIQVDPAIDQENCHMPSMVLQPFVENAIWHGLLPQEEVGKLTINIAEKEESLQCTITDNGVGREQSSKLQKEGGYKKKSMGIKITGDRLRLLNQDKIEEVIQITDLKNRKNQPSGTQVNVLIPIS